MTYFVYIFCSQHKVLREKLCQLRARGGQFIEPQPEPARPRSRWDFILSECCDMGQHIKSLKRQLYGKRKLISGAVRKKWGNEDKPGHGLRHFYRKRYQQRRYDINNMIFGKFQTTIMNKGDGKHNRRQNKVFPRKPNLEIAESIQMKWNELFQEFDKARQEIIKSTQNTMKSSILHDGVVNVIHS